MTAPMPEIVKKYFWYKEAYRRVYKENKNATFLFTGDVGCGKSWAALRFCSDLDPTFSVERVVFSVKDFLTLLDQKDEKGEPTLKRGHAVVFDEIAGSDEAADSRSFMTKNNKQMSYISTTCRVRGLIMIYCAPFSHQIDKNVRMIGITGRLSFKKVDFYKKKSRAVYRWSYPRSDDQAGTIMPLPRCERDGRIVKVGSLLISKPPEELIDAYEAKKKQFVADNIHKMLVQSQSKKTVFDGLEQLKITARQMRSANKSWNVIAGVVGRSPSCVRQWLAVEGESTLHTGSPWGNPT